MMKKEQAKVLSQACIATDIYSLWLSVSFANEVKAGQFVTLYLNDRSRLLPRPISICEADAQQGAIRLVYRTVGAGTKEISGLQAGDEIQVMGPLGNGFPLEVCSGKRVLLVGGGIGIPPMYQTAKNLIRAGVDVRFVAGYRSSETYLLEDMQKTAPVTVATDDGSLGVHGTVTDAILAESLQADIIFACGPKPMLRSLKEYAEAHNTELWVSMEERMACGIGACLGCVCKTTREDGHSHVKNARVCKDGPVFPAGEVDLT